MLIRLSKRSSIIIEEIPDELLSFADKYFNEMFNLHPENYGLIICNDNEVLSQRFHQSYLCTPQYDKEKFKNKKLYVFW